MLQLPSTDGDDPGYVELASQIVDGALTSFGASDVFLVQIDNWFDFKWLGWRSRRNEAQFRVPMFTPNRVLRELHFVYRKDCGIWESVEMRKPLHTFRPGRTSLAEPLDRYARSAAFVWYSGRSLPDQRGSLMFYLAGAEGYAWYASFRKAESWTVTDVRQITKRELESFAALGRARAFSLES